MTCQICSSVRRSSHAGIAELHGVDSLGNPGPPLAIRQKRYDSCSIAIVPGSSKFAGGGVSAEAKSPWPSRLSPGQNLLPRTEISPAAATFPLEDGTAFRAGRAAPAMLVIC